MAQKYWYCDTETLQVNKYNYRHLKYGIYIPKARLIQETYYNEIKKAIEEDKETLYTMNILNTGVSSDDEKIFAFYVKDFFDELVRITKIGYKKEQQKKKKQTSRVTTIVYYHNLKFDLFNILSELDLYFKDSNVYKRNITVERNGKKQHKYQIDDKGKIYSYTIYYKGLFIEFRDSYNLITLPLSAFGKTFDLPIEQSKSEYKFNFKDIDFCNKLLSGDRKLIDYGLQDVITLKAGLEKFHSIINKNKLTASSCAFSTWLDTLVNKDNIPTTKSGKPTVPKIDGYYQYISNTSYLGGICNYNRDYAEKIINKELVYLDVNSLYPASMYSNKGGFTHYMPWGIPKEIIEQEFNIEWLNDRSRYFEIELKIYAKLKRGLPFGFVRYGKQCRCGRTMDKYYKQNEYLNTLDDSNSIIINSIDLRNIFKYYDVIDYEIIKAYEYDTRLDLFDDYIDIYGVLKEKASKEKNNGLKYVCKLLLNGLYGKFGQMLEDKDITIECEYGINKFKAHRAEQEQDTIYKYMPIASAITAYAREILITQVYKLDKSEFLYCDTDSIIMTKQAFDKKIDKNIIDSIELGKWDIEHKLKKIKILRQKTYIYQDTNGDIDVRACGATPDIKKVFTFDNFNFDSDFNVKQKKVKSVIGGLAIEEHPFKMKKTNFYLN